MSGTKHVVALSLIMAALLLGVFVPAKAAFPDRPVYLVIGNPPGGGSDTVARLIGAKLSERWGQPVVVESHVGAGGTLAAEYVANAKPDGYTLGLLALSITVNPELFKVNYDPVESFAPITQVGVQPDVLEVLASSPIKTARDFVDAASDKPGHLNFGASNGQGDPGYLAMALLMKETGINVTYIPYTGGSQSMVALLGGEIDVMFGTMGTATGQIAAGKIRALAVTTKIRSAAMPDVPTIGEALELPDFDITQWVGIFAPSGTPAEIVNKLNNDIVAAIKTPDVHARLTSLGWDPVADSPEHFAKTVKDEVAKWRSMQGTFLKKQE